MTVLNVHITLHYKLYAPQYKLYAEEKDAGLQLTLWMTTCIILVWSPKMVKTVFYSHWGQQSTITAINIYIYILLYIFGQTGVKTALIYLMTILLCCCVKAVHSVCVCVCAQKNVPSSGAVMRNTHSGSDQVLNNYSQWTRSFRNMEGRSVVWLAVDVQLSTFHQTFYFETNLHLRCVFWCL